MPFAPHLDVPRTAAAVRATSHAGLWTSALRASLTTLAAVLGQVAVPPGTAAQDPSDPAGSGLVRSSALRAEVPAEGGAARVEIDYVLETQREVVSVELLRFGPADVRVLELGGGPGGEVVRLRPASGLRLAAELPLPAPGPDGGRRLTISYDVTSAVEGGGASYHVRLPVASIALPSPSDVAGRAFSAAVRVPAGWSVIEGFPSGLSMGPGGALSVELAVVPALVSFRGRRDGRSPLGPQQLAALMGGAVLLGLTVAGWRHLRRVAA